MTSNPTYPRFTGTEPCVQVGTEHYFTHDDKPAYENLRTIKSLCNQCHSKDPCLEYALSVNVQGIWGGTVEKERREIRRERSISPIPITVTYDNAPVSLEALKARRQRAARKQIA